MTQPNKQARRGPWSPDEAAAIERAIDEGKIRRVEAGHWPEAQRITRGAIIKAWYATTRDPR